MFLADLSVFRLITIVWAKLSQNSYLRELCAQVSQIVFLADLTVLRLIATLWAKISKNSYNHEFCAQVSQIPVFTWFDRFTASYNYMSNTLTKRISPRVLCKSITKCVPSWFDHFTDYYNFLNKNVTRLISRRVLCTSVLKSCSQLVWPFYGLLQLYEEKCHKTHISASSVHKYHKSCS